MPRRIAPILAFCLLADGCSVREQDRFGYSTPDLILRVEELPAGELQERGRALVADYQRRYLAGRPEQEWRQPLEQLAKLLGVRP